MEEENDGMDRELTRREFASALPGNHTRELEHIVGDSIDRLHNLITQYYDIDDEMHRIGNQADADVMSIEDQMSEIQNLIQKTR